MDTEYTVYTTNGTIYDFAGQVTCELAVDAPAAADCDPMPGDKFIVTWVFDTPRAAVVVFEMAGRLVA